MSQLQHPHTGHIQTASGAAADFLRGKGYTEVDVVAVDDLKGKALAAKLDELGLPKTGTANEQRAAVAAHVASTTVVAGEVAQLVDQNPADGNTVATTATDPTQG